MPGKKSNANDLPADANQRLQEMRSRKLFTSDLSVNEFLLVKEAGFDPVGLVVGSSIYHIGFQFANYSQNQELGVLTQAMYSARELAMSRMEEEADQLGADGIVGVRLQVGQYSWGQNLAEFMAIGTAVRARDSANTNYRTPQGKPFTSDLSGQDFRTLLMSGYRPIALTMGTCVYHVGVQGLRQWFNSTMGQNVEMANYTQAIYDARELAMERMQAEAEADGAEGIVGARIIESSYGWDSHVIEFFAIGTAIIPTRPDHQIQSPQMVISLNDQQQ
ncbi:MAG TPA: heavy metal-binding domain-containing protein [Ktedonobacterales bacterium]|nr:heavy metal-binding domain-containing protein [Ktedonobacterales bacterium]